MTVAVSRDYALAPLTTLALPATAAHFCAVTDVESLIQALDYAQQQHLPVQLLGGGSNTVFSGDYPGMVIHLAMTGVRQEEQGQNCLVHAAAGENWNALVEHCLGKGLYGIENLIAIPGSVGAAPVQNIGAYGVELAEVLESVTVWDRQTASLRQLSAQDCKLAYRDSLFKSAEGAHYIIVEVCLRLHTEPRPVLSYDIVKNTLVEQGVDLATVSPEQVSACVARIRGTRLPNYQLEPNAGSFFKNPLIPEEEARSLLQRWPDVAHWPMPDGRVKLAAAWLVEQCGWKGQRMGPVGVHPRQSIVLVNYDNGSGAELMALAGAIQQDVRETFGVSLEIEPRVV